MKKHIYLFFAISFLVYKGFSQEPKLINLRDSNSNVIYVGIPNKFKVLTTDINSFNFYAKGAIVHLQNDTLFLTAMSPDTIQLIIRNAGGKEFKSTLFSINWPVIFPTLEETALYESNIHKENILAFKKIKLVSDLMSGDNLFNNLEVVSYKIMVNDKYFEGKGNLLTEDLLNEIRSAKIGTRIQFLDLRVRNTTTNHIFAVQKFNTLSIL